jgi:phosphotransferase system enzyme I (PtsI)
MKILKGISVASGIAIAKPFVLESEGRSVPLRQTVTEADLEKEIKSFHEAIEKAEENILKSRDKLEATLGKGHGAIFEAHLMILKDPLLVESTIEEARASKVKVGYAFARNVQKLSQTIAGLRDPYLQERFKDIEDVGWQVMTYLTGRERRSLKNIKEKVIVLAEDLSPAETADMPKGRILGFATITGSRTSHTAIVAQALELPALVGVKELREIIVGDKPIILDAVEGVLIIDPDEATLSYYKRQQVIAEQRTIELRKMKQLTAETPDGHRVRLMVNLELPLEVNAAVSTGAEGIGLYRTEFMFLNRTDLPGEEEQYKWYSQVVKAMGQREVVIRTVDLGGDKFLKEENEMPEMNPFLGLRGVRMSLANQGMFRTQLRAILRTSSLGKVHLMFPMISSVEEFRKARVCVEEVKAELRAAHIKFDEKMPVGAMIETPAAALVADKLAREADFFSIGSNDLIQYSIAVDRGNPGTNHLYEPLHPAILRLIQMTINMAHSAQIPVSVCGEIAADPFAAVLLLGLGLDTFSVSPVSYNESKRIIRSVSFVEAREVALEAVTLPTAQAVKELVRGRVGDRVMRNA